MQQHIKFLRIIFEVVGRKSARIQWKEKGKRRRRRNQNKKKNNFASSSSALDAFKTSATMKTFGKVEDVSRQSDTINIHITVFKLLRHLKSTVKLKKSISNRKKKLLKLMNHGPQRAKTKYRYIASRANYRLFNLKIVTRCIYIYFFFQYCYC